MAEAQGPVSGHEMSRRRVLLGAAVAGLGAAAAVGADYAISAHAPADARSGAGPVSSIAGNLTTPYSGKHQAGVDTAPQSHARFIALDLADGTDAGALRRMMHILSNDVARLTRGEAALADSEPELAEVPARLTVTFGFGPRFVTRAAGESALPPWLGPLPSFTIDRLEPAWTGGDLLLHVAADDLVTVAHASRMLLKDARSFARVRWTQTGFRRARESEKPGTTMRNLFGEVDGTANPKPGSDDFDRLVWAGEGWWAGGTGLVMRRIRMDLDRWDRLDRSGREQSIGRYLSTGAPLTGTREYDSPDFEATTAIGFPVIPEFSHMRRARSDNTDERIYRRGYNYEIVSGGSGLSESGLIFAAYQADVTRQYLPLQTRLDQLDLLNQWTTPIGSAAFVIPPGCEDDGYIGETLF